MPYGQCYLWTAPTLTRHRGGWGEPGKTFAVGLGCELRHASRLVWSDGLDLGNASAATPIGMECRVCERLDCPQWGGAAARPPGADRRERQHVRPVSGGGPLGVTPVPDLSAAARVPAGRAGVSGSVRRARPRGVCGGSPRPVQAPAYDTTCLSAMMLREKATAERGSRCESGAVPPL